MARQNGLVIRLALVAAVLGASSLVGAETKTIRIGVKGDMKPMGYTEGGALKGFDVELAHALVAQMNAHADGKVTYVAELQVVTTQDRFSKLEDGKVDMLVATVSITSARQAIYRISDPYFYTSIKLVTPDAGSITSVGMIRRKTVGVLKNASTVDIICQMEGVKVLLADTLDDLLDLLRAGTIDAIAVDSTFIPGMLEKLGVGYTESAISLGFEPYGVVVGQKFGDGELKDVNDIIGQLTSDGTIEQIAGRYGLPYRSKVAVRAPTQ